MPAPRKGLNLLSARARRRRSRSRAAAAEARDAAPAPRGALLLLLLHGLVGAPAVTRLAHHLRGVSWEPRIVTKPAGKYVAAHARNLVKHPTRSLERFKVGG